MCRGFFVGGAIPSYAHAADVGRPCENRKFGNQRHMKASEFTQTATSMRHTTLYFPIASIGLCAATQMCAQQQTLIDAPFTYSTTYGALPRPGGGTVAAFQHQSTTQSDRVVLALDAQGGLQWARSLTPVPSINQADWWTFDNIAPQGTDRYVLSGYASPLANNHEHTDDDTTYIRHAFTSISDEGEINAMWMLTRTVIGLGGWVVDGPDVQQVTAIPSGGYYLLLDYSSPIETLELVRLTATGEVMWARSIGTPEVYWETFPTFGETQAGWNMHETRLACTSSGGAFIANYTDDPVRCLMVKKIEPDGSLAWSKNYCFNNPPEQGRFYDARVGSDGNLHVLEFYGPIGSDVVLALEIQSNGSLTSADVLSIPSFTECTVLGEQDGHQWLLPRNADRIIHVLPDGVIQTRVFPSQLETPYTLSVDLGAAVLVDDTIRMTSNLRKQHNDFMTVVNYPVIWRMPVTDLDVCSSYNFTSNSVPVPLDNFTVTDDTEEVSINITEHFSSAPADLYTLTEIAPSAFDPCEFNVGVVEELTSDHALWPSTLSAGEEITLKSQTPVDVKLIDMEGRVVLNFDKVVGTETLPVRCSPGCYLVRATDSMGTVLWCERITVH